MKRISLSLILSVFALVSAFAQFDIAQAPLPMLADSPTKYMQNQACTDFIAQIPTTFDETIALDGRDLRRWYQCRQRGYGLSAYPQNCQ